jgi:hypothetical protein
MKHLFSIKPLIAAAVALGAIGASSVAQARDDVQVRIAVGEPHGQYQTYDRGDRFEQRGYERSHRINDARAFRDADRDGIPNLYDPDSRFYDWRAARRHVQWGDFDRDGVVNAFDRAPNNPRRH